MPSKQKFYAALNYPLLLVLVVALSMGVFLLLVRYDNKYTTPTFTTNAGRADLDTTDFTDHPLVFLIDGWELYSDALLTPQELPSHQPDITTYLGQYAGFDRGDPSRSRHGAATYRLTIKLPHQDPAAPAEYALEVTQIYSQWQLYINGELRQNVGDDPVSSAAPTLLACTPVVAADGSSTIEIVVAVSDQRGIYSGMVYPPAFGSPHLVSDTITARLLIHAGAITLALALGLFCLLAGLRLNIKRPYIALFLLCLCFSIYTAYPLFLAFGLYQGWPLLERLAYYGIFLLVIWLQGSLTQQPKVMRWLATGIAAAICLMVLVQALIPNTTAGQMQLFGLILTGYKWMAMLWLLVTTALAARRAVRWTKALLAGFGIFACALLVDRIYPQFEPIIGGWPVELAGLALILIVAGILWRETVAVYRDNLVQIEQKKQTQILLAAQQQYGALQQVYVQQTNRHLHETRNRLLVIQQYSQTGQVEALNTYLAQILGSNAQAAPHYTDNALLDAVLYLEFSRASDAGIYLIHELRGIPPTLPISQEDLTSLLMNVLDNAINANLAVANQGQRWLYLHIRYSPDPDFAQTGTLLVQCNNALDPTAQQQTDDPRAHGFGSGIIKQIVQSHQGTLTRQITDESYSIIISLQLNAQI